jgi:hypothetical protein
MSRKGQCLILWTQRKGNLCVFLTLSWKGHSSKYQCQLVKVRPIRHYILSMQKGKVAYACFCQCHGKAIRQSINVKVRHIFNYINSKEKVTCACFYHGHGKAHLSKYQCQGMNWLVVLGQAVYILWYNDCKYQVFFIPPPPKLWRILSISGWVCW